MWQCLLLSGEETTVLASLADLWLGSKEVGISHALKLKSYFSFCKKSQVAEI